MEKNNCFAVANTIPPNLRAGIRNRSAAPIEANRQEVPAAASKSSLNTAGYFEGARTEGGTRSTQLFRPAQFKLKDALLSHTFTASTPHNDTNSTSNAYGDHA